MRLGSAVLPAAATVLAGFYSYQLPVSSYQHSVPANRGVQDPAWAPDGRTLATSFLDRIWISDSDGRKRRPLRASSAATERDPSWSPDGRSIAFAVETATGFDLFVGSVSGGDVRQLTDHSGDERWPSWTQDGRIIFSRRENRDGRWRLFAVPARGGESAPLFHDAGEDDEREGRVSPDGTRIAYVSDRDNEDADFDLWVAALAVGPRNRVDRTRLVRVRGLDGFPSWAPDGTRLAFYAVREGAGAVWVAGVDIPPDVDAQFRELPSLNDAGGASSIGDRVTGSSTAAAAAPAQARVRPSPPPVLVSRHGGVPAWSPDGKRIVIAALQAPLPVYNGDPLRNTDEPPPLFATDAFRLWIVDAPLPVDAGSRELTTAPPQPAQLVSAFDRVWETLRRLYYSSGPSAEAWAGLREKYRTQASAARDEASLETVVDRLVAEQPLIKAAVSSGTAVVVSGHPLASEAGALALARGGNVVDAAIATSFALGVVEPDASGIGGDGMAILFLKGMSEPIVIDYKDQSPIRATSDNERLRASSGDGPAAANIPGVVAGLDYLHRHYGSKNVPWPDLIAPAIQYAEEGYVLDEALPTSIAESRKFFEKYAASKRIYLPGGSVPRPGQRFVNKDYAATLRAIARDGAQTFYRGDVARRIAADMASNGGILTLDDLAQYRAIERRPLSGRYRDHAVYSAPPPSSTGLQLIETLQILQNYQPKAGAAYVTDADYFHYVLESWKVRDQGARTPDPGLFDINLGQHLDPGHAAGLFKRIDPLTASRYRAEPQPRPGTDGPPRQDPAAVAGLDDENERIGRGTTGFVVADAEGNMIAVTQTLSTWGGTFYVSEGLGFLYNNHLRLGGAAAGSPGRFLPLTRSSSTTVPTLLFKAAEGRPGPGTPRLAVAAAGNAWIPASVYDIILNVVDAGMPAQQAVEAPRFLVGRDPLETDAGRMQIEDRFPRSLLQNLIGRGHRFQKIGRKGEVRQGYASAVVIDVERRQVQAGTEPRRSHGAAVPVK